jgi:hypothetical protein
MAEQPLSVDRGVYLFFEMIALGFVLTGVDMAVKGEAQPIVLVGCFAAAAAFFLIGIFSARILAALGSNAADIVEWFAGYTWLMVIGVTAYVVATQPGRPRYFALGGASAYFLIAGVSYIRALRRDLDRYVMPRRLTGMQERRLRSFLSGEAKYAITLNANPLDSEAMSYARQLQGVFNQSGWDVQLATVAPYPQNEGLAIDATGTNQGIKNDPRTTIHAAFAFARIHLVGSGGAGAGEFKVTIAVGTRPLAIYRGGHWLTRIGYWIMRLGQPR